jgi:hypothetical protein
MRQGRNFWTLEAIKIYDVGSYGKLIFVSLVFNFKSTLGGKSKHNNWEITVSCGSVSKLFTNNRIYLVFCVFGVCIRLCSPNYQQHNNINHSQNHSMFIIL